MLHRIGMVIGQDIAPKAVPLCSNDGSWSLVGTLRLTFSTAARRLAQTSRDFRSGSSRGPLRREIGLFVLDHTWSLSPARSEHELEDALPAL